MGISAHDSTKTTKCDLLYYFHKNNGFQTYCIHRKRWPFEMKEGEAAAGEEGRGGCFADCNPVLVV